MSACAISLAPTSATKSGRDCIAQSWTCCAPRTFRKAPRPSPSLRFHSREDAHELGAPSGLCSNSHAAAAAAHGALLQNRENVIAEVAQQDPNRRAGQHVAEKMHSQDNS